MVKHSDKIKTLALADLRSGKASPFQVADDIIKYEKQEKYEVCQGLKEALTERTAELEDELKEAVKEFNLIKCT